MKIRRSGLQPTDWTRRTMYLDLSSSLKRTDSPPLRKKDERRRSARSSSAVEPVTSSARTHKRNEGVYDRSADFQVVRRSLTVQVRAFDLEVGIDELDVGIVLESEQLSHPFGVFENLIVRGRWRRE